MTTTELPEINIDVSGSSTDDQDKKSFIQFLNSEGNKTGDPVYIPSSLKKDDLENIVKGILNDDCGFESKYEFFIGDIQILDDISKAVKQFKAKIYKDDPSSINSVESIVNVTYQKQSNFCVRPVTRCTSTLPGHKGAILVSRFSPDGSYLATGSGDATIRLWDLTTEMPAFTGSDAHYMPVLTLEWAPDGLILASGCQGGRLCLWKLIFHAESVEYTPMKLLHTLAKPNSSSISKTSWIRSIAWRPYHIDSSCRFIACAYQDSSITIWDTKLGTSKFIFTGHEKPVTNVRWGGTDLLYSSSQDRTIKVWSFESGALLRTLSVHGHWVNCLALSTDYVLRTGPFDPAKLTITKSNPHADMTDDDSREKLQCLAQEMYQKCLGSDKERMVSGSDDNTLSLWIPEKSNQPIGSRMTGHQGVVNDVRFSPDGRFIASASFDHSVKIWDGLKGTFLATMYGHVQEVYLLSWSSDSRLIVSASKDSTVKLWNMAEVRRWSQEELTGGKDAELGTGKFKRRPNDAVITADNVIAKKRVKKSIGFFQGKRHLLHDLPGHSDAVYAIDWSPDGQRVASGGKDKVLKIWRS